MKKITSNAVEEGGCL